MARRVLQPSLDAVPLCSSMSHFGYLFFGRGVSRCVRPRGGNAFSQTYSFSHSPSRKTLPGKRTSPHVSSMAVVSIVEEEPESLIAAASSTDTVIDVQPEEPKRPFVRELLSIPVLQAVFVSSAALGFAGSCFNSVFVLMAYSPIKEGGLALSVRLSSPVSPSSSHTHFRRFFYEHPTLFSRLQTFLGFSPLNVTEQLRQPTLLRRPSTPPRVSPFPLRTPPPAIDPSATGIEY